MTDLYQSLARAGHLPREIPHPYHAPGAIECGACRLRARLEGDVIAWHTGQGGDYYHLAPLPACLPKGGES